MNHHLGIAKHNRISGKFKNILSVFLTEVVKDRLKLCNVSKTIPTLQDEQSFPQDLIIAFLFCGERLQTRPALSPTTEENSIARD